MGRRIINRRPPGRSALLIGAFPFLVALLVYVAFSSIRLAENPADKLLPALTTIGDAVARLATEEDARTGHVLLWSDTAASLTRLCVGLAVATLLGLVLGVATGLIPYAGALFSPFIAVLSMVPPMAVLPILFIVFGLDELSKVVLIVVGIAPFLTRDLALRVKSVAPELIIKAQTLGASTWQIIVRLILPSVLPQLIDAVRLSLGPAWLFLISAEAIAAQDGLGYRIFLMRRYMAMDVILPYVAWITLLAFAMDWALRRISRRAFPWLARGTP